MMKAEKQSQFGSESRLTRVQELKQDSQRLVAFKCFQQSLEPSRNLAPRWDEHCGPRGHWPGWRHFSC